MPDEKTLEQARQIFSQVKVIRNRMLKVQREAALFVQSKGMDTLTVPQLHTVFALETLGEVTISQLAEALDVSAPSASVMVDRLVEKDVLVRRHCEEDRRKVLVSVSPKVKVLMTEFERIGLSVFVDLVEKIGPETTNKFLEVMDEVKKAWPELGH